MWLVPQVRVVLPWNYLEHSQIQIRLELPQMLGVFPTFTERFFHVVHITLSCLQYDSVLSKDSFFVYFNDVLFKLHSLNIYIKLEGLEGSDNDLF